MAERTRTITWDDPETMPGRAAAAAGLETLRRVAAGELPPTPMARLMDIRLTVADPGRVVFESQPAEFHYNFSGAVHGGFAATLLDSAMACAIYTTLDAGQNCPTLELKINYVKAITRELGAVRGIGTVVHRGRTTAIAEGRVETAGGVLLACATTTCLIVPTFAPAELRRGERLVGPAHGGTSDA
ncbi:MAG: PaaI family thioesterase [Vicinamibacterales bacterium]